MDEIVSIKNGIYPEDSKNVIFSGASDVSQLEYNETFQSASIKTNAASPLRVRESYENIN